MKKSKLPKKQWKTPSEQELFDHLPAKLEYNFEGLSEKEQQENFKDSYMQALASYLARHPVNGHFKGTYGMMFSRDEGYAKRVRSGPDLCGRTLCGREKAHLRFSGL